MNTRTKIAIALTLLAFVAVGSTPKADPPSERVPPRSAVPSTASPPVAVQRSILVHQADFHCPACERLKPEIASLRKSGWSVAKNMDSEAAKRDSVRAFPTIIGLRNGVEIFRHVGYLDAVAIAEGCNLDHKSGTMKAEPMRSERRSFRFGLRR